jgi:hypothetical protein
MRLIYSLVGTILAVAAPASAGFQERYSCEATHSTMAGWQPTQNKWEMKAGPHAPGTRLMLTDVVSPSPTLVGNAGTAKLQVVTRLVTELQMVEVTTLGSVVTWAFFDADPKMNLKSATLITTKTYDFFGPASFTTVYRCDPTAPMRR